MKITVNIPIDVFNSCDTPEKVLQKLKEKLDRANNDKRYRPVLIDDSGEEMHHTCTYWSNSVKFDLMMDIKVRLFDQYIPLSIGVDQTIAELKAQINQLKTIDPLWQTLTFDGRQLDLDEKTLSFYKIKPDSIIKLELNST